MKYLRISLVVISGSGAAKVKLFGSEDWLEKANSVAFVLKQFKIGRIWRGGHSLSYEAKTPCISDILSAIVVVTGLSNPTAIIGYSRFKLFRGESIRS